MEKKGLFRLNFRGENIENLKSLSQYFAKMCTKSVINSNCNCAIRKI